MHLGAKQGKPGKCTWLFKCPSWANCRCSMHMFTDLSCQVVFPFLILMDTGFRRTNWVYQGTIVTSIKVRLPGDKMSTNLSPSYASLNAGVECGQCDLVKGSSPKAGRSRMPKIERMNGGSFEKPEYPRLPTTKRGTKELRIETLSLPHDRNLLRLPKAPKLSQCFLSLLLVTLFVNAGVVAWLMGNPWLVSCFFFIDPPVLKPHLVRWFSQVENLSLGGGFPSHVWISEGNHQIFHEFFRKHIPLTNCWILFWINHHD